MEDIINDGIKEHITWVITDVWTLHEREDLLADCFDFVTDEVMGHEAPITDTTVLRAVCKFLQIHCHNAISSQDIEDLAKTYNKH